jgi:hypothetical protein
MGYGEMVKWVTCREPSALRFVDELKSSRSGPKDLKVVRLVKFTLTGKFKVFFNEKLPLKTNIPLFHYSIIPYVKQKVYTSINHFSFSST